MDDVPPRLAGLLHHALIAFTFVTAVALWGPHMFFSPTRSVMQPRVTSSEGCDASPGAPAGSPTLGQTNYLSNGTTYVSNTVFNASHSDDLVRINNGKVIFDHVTFQGTGTGLSGHTLEVKVGGAVEVRNSKFEGDPTEDTIQTSGNDPSLIECNQIGGTPGEDHIDTKSGGDVTIRFNTFTTSPTFRDVMMHNADGLVHTVSNTGIDSIMYELPDDRSPATDDSTGTIVNNNVSVEIWLYDVTNVLVEGNTTPLVKHGDSGIRDPEATYFLNNDITTFQFNGGTCYKDGNTGNALSSCTSGPPPWY